MKLHFKIILALMAVALVAILAWWVLWIAGIWTSRPAAATRPSTEAAANIRPSITSPTDRAAAVQAYNRARQYQSQQDYTAAITYYRAALTNDPGMANAWFNLGLIYAERNDIPNQRDAYENAIAAEPTMIAARYNLALLLLGEHERDEALTHLREIVRLQPDNADAHYVLGYALSDDPLAVKQAKDSYLQFLALAPDNPNAANVRDWLAHH
ncbi:MAG: tetratricopeptide repeat protein [Kiritimatiellaeota bacterium]|nr:tetratricopeptide repeat protein [Kiritimatiellota bacterium]